MTGRNDEEHAKNLDAVLQRIQDSGLRLREDKCQFFVSEVRYLGFKLDQQGLHPLPDKLEPILNLPDTTCVAELQSFLGMAQYSVSPIYRGRVHRGFGYIAVACWTLFFCPPISRILQMWRPRARYFSRNRGNSLHSIRGRQFFAKSAHRDSLCSCSLETIFREINSEPTCQCELEHMLCDGQPR